MCAIAQRQLRMKRMAQTHASAQLLGRAGMVDIFPFASSSCKPVREDCVTQLALNRWWRPQLSIVGAAGLPSVAMSGNVLRPSTTLVLSLRLPPTVDKEDAIRIVTETLTKDPPYGAKVTFTVKKAGSGWSAPDLKPWQVHQVLGFFFSRCFCICDGVQKVFTGFES